MTSTEALSVWCEWARRNGPVKPLPGSTSPYIGGLRKPSDEAELKAILDGDTMTTGVDQMVAEAYRECPDLVTVRAVEQAFSLMSTNGTYPTLLRRYVLHRIGDGRPASEFKALDFPPDAGMPRTLREMGWSVDGFLETSLERLRSEVDRLLERDEP